MNPVRAKFELIHNDLEANVTKIYRRHDLAFIYDLCIHSVIQFRFQGDLVRKGWVEALIIGDTRCGKSESIDRLSRHYRSGEMVSGEGASYAGLVGGLQQIQNHWSITWGKMVLNDRRALTVDEFQGLSIEAIGRLSGVRSSGMAEINKIQSERTLARVRLFALANPRGRRPLAGFNTGMHAIEDLIGAPEDIARFDVCGTVASKEVPVEVINAYVRPIVPHVYTSAACAKLVNWAWSRRPDDVVWQKGTEHAVLDAATALSKKFAPPLVEPAEQRIKVARLSVAAAARVFSTDDGRRVVVTPAHVEFVAQFLEEVYCKPSMALDIYSAAKHSETHLHDSKAVKEKLALLPADFRGLLSDAPSFSERDVQDFGSLSRDAAADLCSFFVRQRCVKKGRFGYHKLPAFTKFLRLLSSGRDPGDDSEPPF